MGPGFVVKLFCVGKGHKLHEVSRWTVLAPDTKRLALEKGAHCFTRFLGGAFLAAGYSVKSKKPYFAKLWFSSAPHLGGGGPFSGQAGSENGSQWGCELPINRFNTH